MKEFHECIDITDAHNQNEITYIDVRSNQAEQFFGLSGNLEKLESNADNPAVVEVIPNNPTTIGSIVKTILRTLGKSGGSFMVDPNKTAGALNILSATKLVQAGVLTQDTIDSFFGIGKIVTYPYKDRTQEELDQEKLNKALYVSTQSIETGYPTLPSSVEDSTTLPEYHIKPKSENISVRVDFVSPRPVDSIIKIYVLEKETSEQLFSQRLSPVSVFTIPAGEVSYSVNLAGSFRRFIQFYGVSDISGDFSLSVYPA